MGRLYAKRSRRCGWSRASHASPTRRPGTRRPATKRCAPRIAVTWQQSLFSVAIGSHHAARHGSRRDRGRYARSARADEDWRPDHRHRIPRRRLRTALRDRSHQRSTPGSSGRRKARSGDPRVVARNAIEQDNAVEATRIKGDVRFEGVGFTYPDGHETSSHDISFTAKPGEMVALVGLTGAGKTTLVSLIPRFYDATAGQVLIDGVGRSAVRIRELRERIALVPAGSGALLRDDRREPALRPSRRHAREDIEARARAAHAHEFVLASGQGLRHRDCRSCGGSLSGGERQRLSVARAILKNAPILILDEPTSSLDAISEEIVFAALRRLRAGRTTIVIAHRLSTVRDADRILVLDGGQIAAQGRHEELLREQSTLPSHVRAGCRSASRSTSPKRSTS